MAWRYSECNCGDCKLDDSDSESEECDFFYPNACQICGCLRRLFRCSKCQMISYCSKEHQTEHFPIHKKICKALAETRKLKEILINAKNRKQAIWNCARIEFINRVSVKLMRNLTPYEEKVIKFTRACIVCHDVDQQNLISCQNCASVSFCRQHKKLFNEVHAEKCNEFKLCYTLDLQKLQKKKSNTKDSEKCEENLDSDTYITVIKKVPIKLVPYLENRPDSMKSFVDLMKKLLLPKDLEDKLSEIEICEIVDFFIKPLSVYQALKKLDLVKKRDLVIHIIGKVEDLDSYSFWEILLHWIPNLLSLKIVIINEEFVRQTLTPKVCEKCIEIDKKLDFELYNLSYKKFIQEKIFLSPNLVIGFNIKTKNEVDSLLSVANLNASFAFTSDSEKIAKENHKHMNKIFKQLMSYDNFERNPFSGIKPRLDFETNGLSYEHQFLTIYTNLENSTNYKRKQKGIPK